MFSHILGLSFCKEREAAKRMFSGKRGQESAPRGKKAKT